MDHTDLDRAARWLREARRVAFFTGAGISAESGVPTFRDEGGFWDEFPVETFGTWGGIMRAVATNPAAVARFVRGFLEPIAAAEPNAAHRAIARCGEHVDTAVITQNVDGLHQDAGSRVVREIHGSVFEVIDGRGKHVRHLSRADLREIVQRLEGLRGGPLGLPRLMKAVSPIFKPSLGGLQRPKVVMFGQALAEPDWTQAQEDASDCDVMVVVGTAGQVYPAAMLPEEAKLSGARVVTIDPSSSGSGDVWLQGTATQLVPPLIDAAFAP